MDCRGTVIDDAELDWFRSMYPAQSHFVIHIMFEYTAVKGEVKLDQMSLFVLPILTIAIWGRQYRVTESYRCHIQQLQKNYSWKNNSWGFTTGEKAVGWSHTWSSLLLKMIISLLIRCIFRSPAVVIVLHQNCSSPANSTMVWQFFSHTKDHKSADSCGQVATINSASRWKPCKHFYTITKCLVFYYY